MFGFLRARRRRKILADPFPAAWQALLHREMGLYRMLDTGERSRLRDELRVFEAVKNWEPVRDFDLTEPMRVLIAAHACLLTLGMSGDPLRHVRTIIVQPEPYVPPQPRIQNGIVQTGMVASGTAYLHGPVVLSWADILADSRRPGAGRNVVLHEFAHQLDMIGGVVDGTPPLPRRDLYPAWQRVMTAEYERLVHETEHGLPTLIRSYGATNHAEFFAVTTEVFFERPMALRERHPELYGVLRAYYGQDTAARAERALERS